MSNQPSKLSPSKSVPKPHSVIQRSRGNARTIVRKSAGGDDLSLRKLSYFSIGCRVCDYDLSARHRSDLPPIGRKENSNWFGRVSSGLQLCHRTIKYRLSGSLGALFTSRWHSWEGFKGKRKRCVVISSLTSLPRECCEKARLIYNRLIQTFIRTLRLPPTEYSKGSKHNHQY